jgi:hypothetical protein
VVKAFVVVPQHNGAGEHGILSATKYEFKLGVGVENCAVRCTAQAGDNRDEAKFSSVREERRDLARNKAKLSPCTITVVRVDSCDRTCQ